MCLTCAPSLVPLLCTICKEMKHPGAFATRHQRCTTETRGIRRCKGCGERCSSCKQYMPDDRSFATNTSVCWKCYKESLKRMCERCAVYKDSKSFDSKLLIDHTYDARKLVCLDCYRLGYSSDKRYGLITYRCIGGHDCGHLAFHRQLLMDYNRRHTSASQLICETCRIKPKYKCWAANCKKEKYIFEFEEDKVRKTKNKDRLVCKKCIALGFSSKQGGDRAYPCRTCAGWFGSDNFEARHLYVFNRKKKSDERIALQCKDCML